MMPTPAEPWPVRSVERIELLKIVTVYGHGSPDDMVRNVTQLFLPDGTEVGRYDPAAHANNHFWWVGIAS